MKPRLPQSRSAALWAAYVATRLGPVGWLGAGLLLLSAAAVLAGPRILERSSAQQTARNAELREQLAQLADPRRAERARDPLAAFVSTLPPESEVPDFVAAVERRAERDAVQIDRTEYRVQPALGHAAERYRLHFPAHVDYPHLRPWLEGLLHDYPSVSLDELALHRAVDGGEELEATVGLSFLARVAP
jgi:hypothetical protein